ncbi:EthD family reductase [Primorskyibacter sp. 2E233]|uniref:EthD family reductase n=1 Tax=Primorskyibacter sp. 2E233 TaxID=3413431 RepID=UPI003BF316BE
MSATLQVIYPIRDDTKFDYDYYTGTHLTLVGEVWGELIDRTLVTKGLAAGPDTPPGQYAIASIVFHDQAAFDAAMNKAGPLLEDIPNFTNTTPQMLVGAVIG